MAAIFELYKDHAGEFRFHLQAANGEVILVSSAYKQKNSAENGIARVRGCAPDHGRYARKVSFTGKSMFDLLTDDGEVVGSSQSFHSASGRDHCITAVKQQAPVAEIVDQTDT